MISELAHRLGAEEAHDLGLQLTGVGDGEEVLAYTTVAYWRCGKCRTLCMATSKLDRRLVLELQVTDAPAYRLNVDVEAVQLAKARHVCPETPPNARPTR